MFVVMQAVGALAAVIVVRLLYPHVGIVADDVVVRHDAVAVRRAIRTQREASR